MNSNTGIITTICYIFSCSRTQKSILLTTSKTIPSLISNRYIISELQLSRAKRRIATLYDPVVAASKASYPIAIFPSAEVIAVPASNPYRVFCIAEVPLKLSPAFVPPTVFCCASDVTPRYCTTICFYKISCSYNTSDAYIV